MGSWDFETGFSDDFDMEITNAYFAYSPKLAREGEPRIALHLEGKVEGGTFEAPTELTDETALLFSVGDKWMIVDDGGKLVDEGGRERGPHVKSAITRLLKSAVEAGAPLRDRGEATEAKIWNGLRLHFNRKTEKMGDTIGDKEVLFVSKYLGEGEGGKKSGATKTVAKPAAAAEASGGSDDVEMIKAAVGGPIFKRLQKLAAESDDYETWASEAVGLPKVSDSDEVQEVVLSEERGAAVWESLRAAE